MQTSRLSQTSVIRVPGSGAQACWTTTIGQSDGATEGSKRRVSREEKAFKAFLVGGQEPLPGCVGL